MIINHKFLIIPPHISTSWNNVLGIHMKDATLVITLSVGDAIHISGLSNELIEKILKKVGSDVIQPSNGDLLVESESLQMHQSICERQGALSRAQAKQETMSVQTNR